jgi:peptidoglycan hydrolase-like protein with peptidoglycan-binding domain
LKTGDKFALKYLSKDPGNWSKPFWRKLQRIMKKQGVYGGAIDGSFGPATKRAIERLAG